MAEISKIEYSMRDLLVLLLKDQNIHEGNWILSATFLQSAINIGHSTESTDIAPASLSILNRIGIELVNEPVPFSVDASAVNPKVSNSSRKKISEKQTIA